MSSIIDDSLSNLSDLDSEHILDLSEVGEEEIATFSEAIQEVIVGVSSINGMTGDVTLTAGDLNAYTKNEVNNNFATKNDIKITIDEQTFTTSQAFADMLIQELSGTFNEIFNNLDEKEVKSNKVSSISGTGDTYRYPNTKAVYDYVSPIQSNVSTLQTNVSGIQDLIPNQATTTNQLADKAFVNSSVQTATANFRGNWTDWANVPTVATDYPADYAGSKTPTVNDYLVVQDASDYTLETLEGTWRFKYTGTWATDGKSGWQPEYQVNETPLTAAQLAALNSGITSGLVAKIPTEADIIITLGMNPDYSFNWSGASSIAAIKSAFDAGANVRVTAPALTDETYDVTEIWWESGTTELGIQAMDNDVALLQLILKNDNSTTYNTIGLQKRLTAGTGIAISGNTISSTITVDQTISEYSSNAVSNRAAYYAAIGFKLNIVIPNSSWSVLADSAPYTYYFDLNYQNIAGLHIDSDSIIELINDNPIPWTKYGWAILSVDTTNHKIRIGSIGKQPGSTTLNIFVKGNYQ